MTKSFRVGLLVTLVVVAGVAATIAGRLLSQLGFSTEAMLPGILGASSGLIFAVVLKIVGRRIWRGASPMVPRERTRALG
jgi:hypothetical protein